VTDGQSERLDGQNFDAKEDVLLEQPAPANAVRPAGALESQRRDGIDGQPFLIRSRP